MTGEDELIARLDAREKPAGIFIMVGDIDNHANQLYFDEQSKTSTMITGKRRPKVNAIPYLNGQNVHLVHCSGSDSLFASWYTVVFDSKPKFLIGLDSMGEIC